MYLTSIKPCSNIYHIPSAFSLKLQQLQPPRVLKDPIFYYPLNEMSRFQFLLYLGLCNFKDWPLVVKKMNLEDE